MSWTELGGFFTRCEHGLFESGRKSCSGARREHVSHTIATNLSDHGFALSRCSWRDHQERDGERSLETSK